MQYFDNNINLRSELRKITYNFENYKFIFNSDLGVFSKDKIDEGSKLLAETYFKYGRKNISILDVGCGIGFLGIALNKIMNCKVDMIDVNNRAIHLTEMNIKENSVHAKVWNSNIYEKVTNKYDAIITNPPIRAGKNIYLSIINDSFNYLEDDGELWFVMRTNHGVKTVVKNLQENHSVVVLKKDKGFYIIKTTK